MFHGFGQIYPIFLIKTEKYIKITKRIQLSFQKSGNEKDYGEDISYIEEKGRNGTIMKDISPFFLSSKGYPKRTLIG